MKLEDQVVSLELSKKLNELGVMQYSVFVWEYFSDTAYGVRFYPYAVSPSSSNGVKIYSAYTVAELGDMLPADVNDYDLIIKKCRVEYEVRYSNQDDSKRLSIEWADSLADAMAKTLIHLIENKIFNIGN